MWTVSTVICLIQHLPDDTVVQAMMIMVGESRWLTALPEYIRRTSVFNTAENVFCDINAVSLCCRQVLFSLISMFLDTSLSF